MDNNKMMLVYGFDALKINMLKEVLTQNNLSDMKIVSGEMTSMTLKEIIDGFRFEIFEKDQTKESAVVFNNFDDKELDLAISEIRKKISGKVILAVVTPTTLDWTFKHLIEHLIEERDWFEKYKVK